ncbi:MAG: nucleotidyl transferase AbiEii/AbiGii toxin family protein [Candidatus Paceibacterota bacterium]
MSEQIKTILRGRLEDLASNGEIDPETRRNALKEDLQYYVLNFVYHHAEYSKWIMYGGSALRIIHGLDRMSVDLDFEIAHSITDKFLADLKKEIESYFANTYGAGEDFLTMTITGRGLLMKFHVGDELSSGNTSKQIHVKIDLNFFVAPEGKIVVEHRPINRGQLSFVILTYNMSALMASKIAAIFLRDSRNVYGNIYDYKGRDIYDLLWYMDKKTVPDFDYLNAKLKENGFEVPDIKKLFDKLTIEILNYPKMDDLLKDDLAHLFENPLKFKGWFEHWRESYLRLLDDYKICIVTGLERIEIFQDFNTDIFSFVYWYKTEEGRLVRVYYAVSDYWIDSGDGNLTIETDPKLKDKIEFRSNGVSSRSVPKDKLEQYATLFYKKTENYFKKTNKIVLGDKLVTKTIRMTADNLNLAKQILLNMTALLSCELDDLMK